MIRNQLKTSLRKIQSVYLQNIRISDQDNFHDNDYDEDDDNEGDIDPSVIAPEGVRRRINRSTIHSPPDVSITRQALTVSRKHDKYNYEKPHKPGFRESVLHTLKKKSECSRKKIIETIYLRLPVIDWLILHYNLKKSLINDIISGVTVAIMNIPQGMAYAMLAGLDPIVGIYMAFFPVLIYATFASSRHCSMGTFAVICIMSGKVIDELATTPENVGFMYFDTTNGTSSNGTTYTTTEVASILSFAVGIWMVIFGFLQMGTLCVFLSDMLVSGFTTGASIHVLTSQIPKLFGIKTKSYQGLFKIPKTWWSILQNIWYSNPTTMVISLICFVVLILNNEVLKPRLRKFTRIPFPIELVVVVVGTLASNGFELEENFDVDIVGDIPTGLPPPELPPFELYGKVLVSSLTITIVSYTVSYSMAKIFAKKLDYNVDATQELYALGLGNLMGSIFSCAPISASLSRSLIQQAVGGETQLASYISCSILVLVLLFIGPFFEPLPNCVLAAVIAVALKGMFLQIYDVITMWKLSRKDALIWIITFLGVVILDIDYGLLVGILSALILLLIRNQGPQMTLMGRVSTTDVYLDRTRYTMVEEIEGIKICQVMGNLHFANRDAFRQILVKTTGLDPRAIMKWKKKQEKLLKKSLKKNLSLSENVHKIQMEDDDKKAFNVNGTIGVEDGNDLTSLQIDDNFNDQGHENPSSELRLSTKNLRNGSSVSLKSENNLPDLQIRDVVSLIIDFTGVGAFDISAANNLVLLHKEFQAADVVVVFSSICESALEVLMKCGAIKDLPDEIFFHSIADAVAYLTNNAPSEESTPTSSRI